MASELRVDTLKDSSGNNSVGMAYVAGGSAKAWANFNGTGTIAARDSFNVSSLTDNGTGSHSLTFSSALNNVNYTHTGMGGYDAADLINVSQPRDDHVPTTTTSRYETTYVNGTTYDSVFIGISVLGDLA